MAADESTRVVLGVRQPSIFGLDDRLDDIRGRVRALERSGRVDRSSVEVWGREVPLDDADDPGAVNADARAALVEFEVWAAKNGRELAPGFRTRETVSGITGERRRVVRLPAACLAVYGGDALRAVYPCSDGTTTRTVPDGLADLESGAAPDPAARGVETRLRR